MLDFEISTGSSTSWKVIGHTKRSGGKGAAWLFFTVATMFKNRSMSTAAVQHKRHQAKTLTTWHALSSSSCNSAIMAVCSLACMCEVVLYFKLPKVVYPAVANIATVFVPTPWMLLIGLFMSMSCTYLPANNRIRGWVDKIYPFKVHYRPEGASCKTATAALAVFFLPHGS